MEKSLVDKLQKGILLFVAVGLIPIALGYGLMPEKSMSYLFNISVSEVNLVHILRAVMGLYLALIIFWILGVMKEHLRQAALISMVVFMLGLAGGRLFSIIIDGIPNILLIVYLFLELLFGILGLVLIQSSKKTLFLHSLLDPVLFKYYEHGMIKTTANNIGFKAQFGQKKRGSRFENLLPLFGMYEFVIGMPNWVLNLVGLNP
jgi:hypothetical protein